MKQQKLHRLQPVAASFVGGFWQMIANAARVMPRNLMLVKGGSYQEKRAVTVAQHYVWRARFQTLAAALRR